MSFNCAIEMSSQLNGLFLSRFFASDLKIISQVKIEFYYLLVLSYVVSRAHLARSGLGGGEAPVEQN